MSPLYCEICQACVSPYGHQCKNVYQGQHAINPQGQHQAIPFGPSQWSYPQGVDSNISDLHRKVDELRQEITKLRAALAQLKLAK